MKKEKKPLTVAQKQLRYRFVEKSTFVSEFAAITTPYIIMGAVNFDEWFKTTDGWKIGLGGSLAIALMCISIFVINKKKEDTDSKVGGYVTLLIGWLAVAFIFLLLANIMHEIATIMFFGAIGIASALGLDVVSKNFKAKADLYKEAMEQAKKEYVKEKAKEDVAKEIDSELNPEKKTVKIKVVSK